MKTTPLVCEPWVGCVLMIGSLALFGAALFGQEGEPRPKRDAKAVARLIDELANRNRPPRLGAVKKLLGHLATERHE